MLQLSCCSASQLYCLLSLNLILIKLYIMQRSTFVIVIQAHERLSHLCILCRLTFAVQQYDSLSNWLLCFLILTCGLQPAMHPDSYAVMWEYTLFVCAITHLRVHFAFCSC